MRKPEEKIHPSSCLTLSRKKTPPDLPNTTKAAYRSRALAKPAEHRAAETSLPEININNRSRPSGHLNSNPVLKDIPPPVAARQPPSPLSLYRCAQKAGQGGALSPLTPFLHQ